MPSDEHYDVIVVGSGFGGSVTAYRLAEADLRVCVLERGKAYPPGSFARRPREMATNYWDPSRGSHGLFNFWSFRGIEALVSSGLGGGSLIYANVLIRKDERWFVQDAPAGAGYESWPITRADLDPHYEQVERMLTATPYPLEAPAYRDTPKTRAMQQAGQRLGLQWGLPNLAVSFAASPGATPAVGVPIAEGAYPNLHGRTRLTCRLCGECDIGCNDGSKNTLDHTYLSAAKHHGADIRVRSEVHHLKTREGGGFSVSYVEHHPDREGQRTDTSKLPLRTVTADRLILAAGTLGTTYLLLRNRDVFPRLGPALGTRFCGNGDLLTLLLRSRLPGEGGPRVLDGSRGPVITSFIRVPDGADPDGDGPGYYVQDAGYPIFVDWLAEGTQVRGTANRLLRFAARRVWDRITGSPKSDLSAELALLHGNSELSSGSLPLLGMGRDVPDGVLRLRRGYLDIDWTTATSKVYFDRVRKTMAAMANELGARFHENPLSYLKRVITVHPLGGCPMGRNDREGVVDSYGQAFNYPGLHIVDGSVMPGPVGPNPSLTIAAFANRTAEMILEDTSTMRGKRPTMTTSEGSP